MKCGDLALHFAQLAESRTGGWRLKRPTLNFQALIGYRKGLYLGNSMTLHHKDKNPAFDSTPADQPEISSIADIDLALEHPITTEAIVEGRVSSHQIIQQFRDGKLSPYRLVLALDSNRIKRSHLAELNIPPDTINSTSASSTIIGSKVPTGFVRYLPPDREPDEIEAIIKAGRQ